MWPYPWTHVGTPSHLGHMDRVAATMPSQAHAGAAQEAPDIGQWEGQDVPLVRPSSCNVKGGIPSSRRYLPTYLDLLCESQSMVTHANWIELWRVVKLKIHQRTGVHVPRVLAISYASSNETTPMSLTHFVKSTVMQAPLPLPLRHYLCSVTRQQAVGGKRVRDLLCTTRINVPWKRL